MTSIALVDVQGGLALSHDPGTWISSLYISAEIVGMALSPWFLVTLTLRRWTLFVIGLNCVSTVLIPLSPDAQIVYLLRLLQGLAGGLTIPLLMTTALRVLPPPIRLYGLAVYALTATFTPELAASMAALWTDVVGWQFVFYETVPICTIACVLVWSCMQPEQPHYERFRIFDWPGALGLVIGFGAFSTMLQQGDRMDWFNSDFICVLALISIVAIPLTLVNEWFHPLPFLKLQMLKRRNFGYAAIALFTFLIIATSASTIPLRYLQEVQLYRPIQSHLITLEIALLQLVMLPLLAFVLDFPRVDARLVSMIGLLLILAACIGNSFITVFWNRDQFYLWQVCQAVGQPMVVMPLLMIATNDVRGPDEAPFASATVNMPRALAEAVGAWLLGLVQRWRGALHSSRIVDQIGQDRFPVIQRGMPHSPPPLIPQRPPDAYPSLQMLQQAIEQQVRVLTSSDMFLVMAVITILLMVILVVLPVRTLPPRIQLAKH